MSSASPRRRVRSTRVALALAVSVLCGCATSDGSSITTPLANTVDTNVVTIDESADGVGPLASTEVHDISITFDEVDYDAMIAAYQSSSDKVWIEATVTIDGATFERAGLRLKGNSSLFALTGRESTNGTSADDPSSLPWLIDLDQYVEQSLDGLTELVVRSNSTTTGLNEAVAQELLEAAGLASQDAIAVSFSVNGSDPVLRLAIDNPDGTWMEDEFGESGALYKAEAEGDYSYRGDDPEAYTDVFDQEAGTDDVDLTPLIEFLEFLDDSDDATFAAELASRLDIESFATYLAFQDMIANRDDIDGPGNNSYLHYDIQTGQMTVVSWDLNLAFGTANVIEAPAGGRGGGGGGRPDRNANVLVERFRAVDEFTALIDAATVELQATLFDSGRADEVLQTWSATVGASGLVDADTVDAEAAAIAEYF